MDKEFYIKKGADRLKSPWVLMVYLGFVLGVAKVMAKSGPMIGFALILMPAIFWFLTKLFQNPKLAVISILYMAFFAIGIVRYVPAPLGLSIDGLLTLGWLAVLFKKFNRTDWTPVRNNVSLVVLMWFGWVVLEIVNPESRSVAAWFFAMRGSALYMLLTITLAFMCFNEKKDLHLFIKLWVIFSTIAGIYGCKQLYGSLNSAELAWLAAGNAKTHILHGKLRVFSFYSDAGQFGASQAHTFLVCMIIAVGPGSRKNKIIYALCGLVNMWGMMISGTRGALFVPIAGVFAYLVLTKNVKVLMLGFIMAGSVFYILKFTFIGQGNAQIARMRTALDPNDASFQVRLENQKKLKSYLASRPIGGGIGSAGYWGEKFSPGTFLAVTPTDSWYVQVWAENGIVGLLVHLFMIFFLLGRLFFIVWNLRDPVLKQTMMALYAGFFGVCFASYGNKVFGQNPTAILSYLSIAFLELSKKFDQEHITQLTLKESKQ